MATAKILHVCVTASFLVLAIFYPSDIRCASQKACARTADEATAQEQSDASVARMSRPGKWSGRQGPRLIIRWLQGMTHKETHKARTRSPIMTCCESLTHGVISQETSRPRSWQSLGRILSHTGEAIIWQKSLKRRHAGNLALFRDHGSNVLR